MVDDDFMDVLDQIANNAMEKFFDDFKELMEEYKILSNEMVMEYEADSNVLSNLNNMLTDLGGIIKADGDADHDVSETKYRKIAAVLKAKGFV